MIYVVHVQSGEETNIVQSLTQNGITAYAPRQELLERRQGEWHTVTRVIFPGYVFAETLLTDEDYYRIKHTHGVIRILGEPTPLSYSEQVRMKWLFDAGIIGVSCGFIKDGRLTVTKGFLLGHENEIVRISRRQKRCKLFVMLDGKRYYFTVSCEIEKF